MREWAEASIALDELKIVEDSKCCLKVQAVISKAGVYDYPEGPTLKPASELLKATRTARYAKLIITNHPETLVIMSQHDLYGGVEKPFWDRNKMYAILNFDKAVTPKEFQDRVRQAAGGGAPLNDSIGFYHKIDPTPGIGPDVNTGVMRPYKRIMRDILIDHVAIGDFQGRCRAPVCGVGVGIDTLMRRIALDPFGEYKDFADCVAKNQKKKSPEGYCAWLHKKITGRYPAQSAEDATVFNLIGDVTQLDDQTHTLIFGDAERPPKAWFDNCKKRAATFADDVGAFCGWLWYHGPAKLKESFGSSSVSTKGGKSMSTDQEGETENEYEKCLTEKKAEGMTQDQAEEACKALKPVAQGQDQEKTKTPWQLCIQKHMAEGLTKEQARMKCKEEGVTQTDQEQSEEEAYHACVKAKQEIEGMTLEEAQEACKPKVDQGEVEEPAESQEELPTPLEQCVANRMESLGESQAEAEAWCKDELAGLHEPAENIVDRIEELKTKDEALSRRHRR